MRWSEVINEVLNPVQMAKGAILDIVASLKAQGVTSITVEQVIQLIRDNPEFDGMAIEGDLINTAINGVDGLKVEPDPETGKLSIMIDNPTAGRQVDQKQAEKDDKAIKSAALRAIDQKDKE